MAGTTHSLTLLLGLTLVVSINGAGNAETGPTLLRKCCPPHQQLDTDLNACVPWAGALAAGAPVDENTAWEGAGLLRQRNGEGFPWWMNPKAPLYDADSGNRTEQPFLRDQKEDAVIRYGPKAPCPRSRARYYLWNDERFRMLSNGTLLLRTDESEEPNLPIHPDLFCIDRVDFPDPETHHAFLTCPCEQTLCIRKCCAQNMELEITITSQLLQPGCKAPKSNLTWTPVFYSDETSNETTQDVQYILLDASVPECDNSKWVMLNNDPDQPANDLRIVANGSVLAIGNGHRGDDLPPITLEPSAWCADTSVVDGRQRVVNALMCTEKQFESILDDVPVRGILYGSLYIASSLFLAATLLVYALLPDLRQTAYSKALLCHVAALLAASLSMTSSQLRTVLFSLEECYLMVFSVQYFFLAAFFWLNAVCFDVAWTFRKMLPPKPCSARERRKFIWYSLYGWGCPAIMAAVTAMMDFAEGIPDSLIKPKIDPYTCWFNKLPQQMTYFYGPLAALLLVNLALYAHTALQLVRARRDTALVDAAGAGGDSARSALGSRRERAILHLKLFLLMGITWVMECVSVAVGQDDAYWYVPDAVNILRGVFVFVLLCCKRDVWRRLRARLGALGCWPDGGGSGGGGSGDAGRQPGAGRSNGYLGPAATEIQQQPRRDTGVTAVTFCDATSKTIRASVDTVVPDVR